MPRCTFFSTTRPCSRTYNAACFYLILFFRIAGCPRTKRAHPSDDLFLRYAEVFPPNAFADARPGEDPLQLLQVNAFDSSPGFFLDETAFKTALRSAMNAAPKLALRGSPILTSGDISVSRFAMEHPSALAFRKQLDALCVLCIDGGSGISDECVDTAKAERAGQFGGEGWELYVAHSGGGASLLGFASVFRFYAYPCNARLRLSQILTLPPHRRKGVGAALMRSLYVSACVTSSQQLGACARCHAGSDVCYATGT